MACRRCGGFMIVELTSASLEDSTPSDPHRIRCLNCGNIEDSVICLNRTDRVPAHGPIARVREGIRL